MSPVEKTDLEPVLRLLFRFLDLSRDLDRNRDDTSFADDNGRITYVVDENVFEVFVRPFDPRGAQVSLHSHHWVGSRQEPAERHEAHTSFAAQAALLTTEYLFSGELPGQADARLFMTEWHGWELARRVQALRPEYARKLLTANEQELAKPFEALRMVLRSLPEAGEAGAGTTGEVDADLARDLADLKEGALNVRKSFVTTRLALKILAENRDIEPAEQLERIVNKPIRSRIQRLHLFYRLSAAQRPVVAQDAARWMGLLLQECRDRGIPVVEGQDGGDRRARVRAALWDDARSLALIRWAAVHGVEAGERLVFITADNLLFDTYRRWYAGLEPHGAEYIEPFVLRRMIQYAPIFNLSASRNVLGGDVREFFAQLQSVVEITMLPLNLSRMRSTAGEQVLTRMREMTALRLLDNAPIRDDPRYADLIRALERKELGLEPRHLEDLLEQWRRLERASLGLAGEYVRARLNEKQRKLEDLKLMTESDEASVKAAFKQYLGQLIERLLEGSREIWLPLAREFIDAWEPRRGHISRAPIPFQLELSVGDTTIGLGQILDRRLNTNDRNPIIPPDAWPALLEAPDIVFAIAACLELVSDEWIDAEHFAAMAERADQARSSQPAEGPHSQSRQVHELRYLSALTKRFRIGELAPPLNVDSLGKVRHGYSAARELLDACVEFHERHEHDTQHRLRLIRALSERAALHLFYTAGLTHRVRIAAVQRLAPKDRTNAAWDEQKRAEITGVSPEDAARQRQAEAHVALAGAEADLRRCLQCEGMLTCEERNAGLFKKLEPQFVVNIAASAVLARLLDPSAPGGTQDDRALLGVATDALARRIQGLLDALGAAAPALFRAELLAFLALRDDAVAHQRLKEIESVSATGKSLSLDLALLDAIRAAARSNVFGARTLAA
jgi:hypothetical protein